MTATEEMLLNVWHQGSHSVNGPGSWYTFHFRPVWSIPQDISMLYKQEGASCMSVPVSTNFWQGQCFLAMVEEIKGV